MFSTWAIAVLIVTSSCSSCGYNLYSRSLLFRRPPSDEPCSRSSSRCSSRSSSIGGPDRYADALVGPLPFNDASYDSSGVIPVSTVQSRSRSIAVPLQLVLRAFSLSAISYVSMRVPRTDADDSTADRSSTINSEATSVLMSDEFELLVDSEPIGLGLVATEYKQFSRIVVKSIKEYAPENVQSRVREGMVLIGINGGSIEGSSTLEEVYLQIKNAAKPIRLLFRDPQLFYQLVQGQVQGDADTAQNSNAEPQGRALYTTSLLPRKGQFPQQILSVERINSRRVAVDRWVHTGDTVEVLYQVRVGQSPLLHTTGELQLSPLSGAVLDGASDATMAAAGGDYRDVYASSIFFVVGNRSPNKYNFFSSPSSPSSEASLDGGLSMMGDFLQVLPASWDSLLVGMGCNEVRLIEMPPCFYRSKAISKELEKYRLLQEDSYLQLAVKCLSINGVA